MGVIFVSLLKIFVIFLNVLTKNLFYLNKDIVIFFKNQTLKNDPYLSSIFCVMHAQSISNNYLVLCGGPFLLQSVLFLTWRRDHVHRATDLQFKLLVYLILAYEPSVHALYDMSLLFMQTYNLPTFSLLGFKQVTMSI